GGPMENYNIYDEIGRGQHSYVYKARRKRSIEYMAVKSTAKDRMNKILNEVQFLRTFSSPYVLKFHNWYESSNHIWIIFEFCIGGDLLNLITQDKTLPESTIKSFGYDMLMGLQYLHSNGVIYCDLKPANVLIDEYGGLKGDKLAPGSPHYMAPELFEQHPVHSFASDFWALQLSPLPPPKTAPPPHRNLARPHQPVKLSTPKPAPHRIFTTLDGVVQPIVACADIEAVAVPRINDTLVPFAVVPVASLATQADIEAKLEQLYHYLRRNDVTVSDKHNALAYLFSISTSSKVANIIVNSSLMTLLGKLLEQSTSSALSSRLGLVLGYVVRYATFIAPDVVASLAPILVQAMDVENVQITRRVVACMGELAFYSVTQHQPLSCALVQSLVRALQADDVIVRHYAVQTVGNILTHSSDDSDVGVVDPFVTPAVALALIEKSLREASPPNLQMAAMLTLSQVLKHTLSQVLNHHNSNDAVFGLVARNLSIVWDHLWLARGSHHFYRWAIASFNVLNVTLQHAAQDTHAFLASICTPDSFDQLSQVLRRREHEEDSSIGGADNPAGGRFKEGEAKLTNLVQGKLLLLVYFGLQLSRDFAVCFVNSDLLQAVDSILSARHPHASAATKSYALQSAHQVVTLSVRIALEVTASLSKRADVLPLFDALLGKLLHYPACRQGLVDTLLDNANHEYEGFVHGLANVVQTPHATSSAIKALLAVLSNQDIVCDVVALNQVWFQSALVQVAQVVLSDTSSPDVLVDGIRVISSALDMFAPAPYVDEFVVHHLLPTFHGLLHSSTNDSARRFAVELLYSIVLRDVAFASILHRLDLIGPVLNLVGHTMSPSTTKLVVLVVTSHEVPVAALLALGLPSILSQAVLTVDNHALVGPTGDLLEAMYALLYDQYIAMTKEEAASSSPDPTLALYAQHLHVFVQCLPRLVDLCTLSSHHEDAQTCVDSASRCISILCQWIGTSLKAKKALSLRDFDVKTLIGTGMLGHVYVAQYKGSRQYFAIKSMWKADVVDRNMLKHVQCEKQTMESLRHPFLIKCYATFQTSDQLHFVLEYVPGGDLFKWLHEYHRFYDHEAKFFAAELVLVLEFMHREGYIYRDLKPENIVLDAHGHIRVIDCGFAKYVGNPEDNGRCTTSVGTPQYLAPEQLRKKDRSYTQAVDWWAFGCVVFELLMGRTPFYRSPSDTPYELYTRVVQGKLTFGDRFTPHAKACFVFNEYWHSGGVEGSALRCHSRTNGGEGVKKRRKCVSKAERLAKKALAGALTEEQRLRQMQPLLESNRSEDWDSANRLVESPATQVLFLSSLLRKQQGRAAAHYMKRWSHPPQYELSTLLKTPALLAILDADASTAATFLNTCADNPVPLSSQSLYFILHQFVLPWIANELDAPLQTLLYNFSPLKWLLLEHALVTGQGRHLVNQYAYVCQELKRTSSSLTPWWPSELTDVSTADTRERIRHTMEAALQRAWPDASVHLFGSSKTNLCQPSDDVDLCVLVPSCDVRGADSADLAADMHGHLALYFPAPDAVVVRHARIPVIKTRDADSHLRVDLCVNNMAALWNTALLEAYLARFPVLRPLCQCIRLWAKARALVGTSHMLSSYSMVLLVIHWLQSRRVVPFVDVAYTDALDVSAIHGAIARAFENAVPPCALQTQLPPVSELLVDFFVFWASDFPYATAIASLRRHDLTKPKSCHSQPLLYLEDPIETGRNLGSYLNRDSQRVLRNEMVRVCVLVRQWQQLQPSPSLLLHSVSFGTSAKSQYDPDALTACILRRRAPHSQCFTMTGDVVFRERTHGLHISTITSDETEARRVVASAVRLGVVGVDCEGAALGRHGPICLVAVAVGCHVSLFDIYTNPALMNVLKPLLEDPTTLKVLHDCRKDSDALYHQFGIALTNVFDTQVGHAERQRQRGLKKAKQGAKYMQVSSTHVIPLGNANHECIAFGDLLWQCLSIEEPDKHHVKAAMTTSTWTQRPLSAQLMHYAAVDVLYLAVLYRVLVKALSADALALAQHRTAQYVACREWIYSSLLDNAVVPIGHYVDGWINNVTPHTVFVSISPSHVAAVAVPPHGAPPLPDSAMQHQLHVGDAVSVYIESVDVGAIVGRFRIPSEVG
ncbi:hypothetical protein DYB34_003468, partial [Aphanomyces astaci]